MHSEILPTQEQSARNDDLQICWSASVRWLRHCGSRSGWELQLGATDISHGIRLTGHPLVGLLHPHNSNLVMAQISPAQPYRQ